MKINLIGQIFGTSGYSQHTKGLANELYKLHDVKLSSPLVDKWELECNDDELTMITKKDDSDRLNLIIDMPHNWLGNLSKKKNIGFLVWEGDRIPLNWLNIIKDKRLNQIWVPSSHVLNAIKQTINWEEDKGYENQQLLQKIKIVPHGVDLNIFKPLNNQMSPVDPKGLAEEGATAPFTFLCNKGFRNELDRGGMQHAIRAFLQEFKKGEARLLLKLNLAYAMSIDQIQQIISKYYQETNKPIEEIPEILLVYDNLLPEQLNDLYNRSDVLINSTESEAFGLPCIESMACGKPVITTNFGGMTDYITDENGWLVDYELREVKHEIMYEGINWAKPNITSLKKAMRSCCEANTVIEKGKKALETSKDWTWTNSAKRADRFLKELE